MGNKIVSIATFSTIEEAYIVKGMLESNGIPVNVFDRNNIYVPVFNGVEVQVLEKDAERAAKLLKEKND